MPTERLTAQGEERARHHPLPTLPKLAKPDPGATPLLAPLRGGRRSTSARLAASLAPPDPFCFALTQFPLAGNAGRRRAAGCRAGFAPGRGELSAPRTAPQGRRLRGQAPASGHPAARVLPDPCPEGGLGRDCGYHSVALRQLGPGTGSTVGREPLPQGRVFASLSSRPQ